MYICTHTYIPTHTHTDTWPNQSRSQFIKLTFIHCNNAGRYWYTLLLRRRIISRKYSMPWVRILCFFLNIYLKRMSTQSFPSYSVPVVYLFIFPLSLLFLVQQETLAVLPLRHVTPTAPCFHLRVRKTFTARRDSHCNSSVRLSGASCELPLRAFKTSPPTTWYASNQQ